MIKIFKFFFVALGLIFVTPFIIYLFYLIKWNIHSSNNYEILGQEAPIIQIENKSYRDLNKNGKLDIYEDPNQNLENRIDDLISQMNTSEKAGLIFFTMIGINEDGSLLEAPNFSNPFSFLMSSSSEMIVKKKINHFNIRASHPIKKMVKWHNSLQKIAERTRLGIPITIASDPRHGIPKKFGPYIHTPYFSSWPSALGMGAINDSILTQYFGEIVREEYKSIGIRVALGPMADISTEPRWGRVDGTFGESTKVNSRLVAAYIKGLQGNNLDTLSVAAMVKHFPGSGALDNGKDSHFPPGIQSYPGGKFEEHLKPFEEAFNVGVASVMPYYSIPKGITSEDVGAGYNKEIITGILRERYDFDGIICTDWAIISDRKILGILFKPASAHGVENLNKEERLIKIIDAGVDMIGGEELSDELAELIKTGKIDEFRIDQSLKRILRQKFKLGLFDNPYLNKDNLDALNNDFFIQKGIEAQRKSLVLLKNKDKILPLKQGTNIYLHGFDVKSIKSKKTTSLEKADVIIAKVETPDWGADKGGSIMERIFSVGRLDFQEEELKTLLTLFEKKPTILVVNIKRPPVLSKLVPFSNAIVADFDSSDKVILDLIFGLFKPSGKLPIQLPSSIESVEMQKEDTPFDLKDPLFDYGYGLSY